MTAIQPLFTELEPMPKALADAPIAVSYTPLRAHE
ncbi:hypothetical protein ACOI3P_28020, partial [Acinetobacter baumannii]